MHQRYWEWDRAFDWSPHSTALLIVDMQQGFLRPGSPLEVAMAREQVATISEVLDAFRERELTAVYTRFVVTKDQFIPFYRTIARQRGIDAVSSSSQFLPDAGDAAVVPPLAPLAGEPVVDKIAYDGFADTALELILRSRGIETLVIVGTAVNWCVDSTLRTAFHRRFNLIVLADGVSGYDHAGATGEQWVAQELDMFAEAFAVVMESSELIAALDARNLRARGGRSSEPVHRAASSGES